VVSSMMRLAAIPSSADYYQVIRMINTDTLLTVLAIGGATAAVVSLIKPVLPSFKLRGWLLRVISVVLGGLLGWLAEGLWDGLLLGVLAGSMSTVIYRQMREFLVNSLKEQRDKIFSDENMEG